MPRLELTLVGCTGLVSTESVGTIDPYCTVQFEGRGYATDPCQNTSEPIWNKTLKFNVSDPQNSQAHICVWNQNLLRDDFLRDYWLNINDVAQNRPDSRKVPLTKCHGNPELHIIVEAVDFHHGSQGAVSSNGSTPTQAQQHQYPPAPQQQPEAQHYPSQQPPLQQQPQQQQQQQQPLPPPKIHTGKVSIRSSEYGTYLQGNRGHVYTSTSVNGTFETWRVEALDSGKYTFCTFDNHFIRGEQNFSVTAVPHCQDWEKWTIEGHPSFPGKMLIRSEHGTYLRAEQDSSKVSLSTNPSEGGDAWEMVTLSGPGINLNLPAGLAFFRSYHDTHLQGHNGKVRTSPNRDAWEVWRIEPLGNGKYALCFHDRGYLSADAGHYVKSASSIQDWEKWTIEGHPTIPDRAVIRSHHNTFLRADSSRGVVDLAKVPKEWEAWEVILI